MKTYKIDKNLRAFLKEVKGGQSLNLAVWATECLNARKMTFSDIEKCFVLGFEG